MVNSPTPYRRALSVAAETVSEEFVDLVADAVLARSDPDETEMPASWCRIDLWGVVGEHLDDEFLDRDPAYGRGCFQTASNLVRNVHGHRHDLSVCLAVAALLVFEL
jgi:hypothetical protein